MLMALTDATLAAKVSHCLLQSSLGKKQVDKNSVIRRIMYLTFDGLHLRVEG